MLLDINLLFIVICSISQMTNEKENSLVNNSEEIWDIVSVKTNSFNVANTSKTIPFEECRSIVGNQKGEIYTHGNNNRIYHKINGDWKISKQTYKLMKSSYGNLLFAKDKKIVFFKKGKRDSINIEKKEWGYVIDVAVDKDENIWVLMRSKLLKFLKDKTISFEYERPVITGTKLNIATSNDDKIFIGSYSSGIFCQEKGKWSKETIPEEIKYLPINNLFTSRNGILWGCSPENNIVFSYNKGEFKIYKMRTECEGFSEDILGNIFIHRKSSYAWHFDPGFDYFDGKGWKIWNPAGIDSLTLSRTRGGGFYYEPLKGVLQDEKGNYWFLTDNLYFYSKGNRKVERLRPEGGLISNVIDEIVFGNDYWYIATTKGISIYGEKGWNTIYLKNVKDLDYKNGKTYVLLKKKILIIEGSSLKDTIFIPSDLDIWDKIAVDTLGNILIVSRKGKGMANINKYWFPVNLPFPLIASPFKGDILCSSNDVFWLAGENRIAKFKQGEISEITPPNNLYLGNINCISFRDKLGLLIGTEGGIFQYKDGKYKKLSDEKIKKVIWVVEGGFNDIWFKSVGNPIKRIELTTGKLSVLYEQIINQDIIEIDKNGNILARSKKVLTFFDIDYKSTELKKVVQADEISKKTKTILNSIKGFFTRIISKFKSFTKQSKKEKPTEPLTLVKLIPPLGIELYKSSRELKNISERLECPPVVDNNKLFILDRFENLASVDINSGKLLWKTKILEIKSSGKIAAYNNKIFILGSRLRMYDAENGKLIMTYSFCAEDMIFNSKIVYFICKNILRGYVVKRYSLKKIAEISLGSVQNKIFTGAIFVFAFSERFQEAYVLNGSTSWTGSNLYKGEFFPACGEDIIASPKEDTIIGINLHKGNVLWKFKSDEIFSTDLYISDNKVFFGSDKGSLYCISEGILKWKVAIPEVHISKNSVPIFYTVISEDVIFVITNKGVIFAYRIEDGKEIWVFNEIKKDVHFPPILYNGKLIIMDSSGGLYVLSH